MRIQVFTPNSLPCYVIFGKQFMQPAQDSGVCNIDRYQYFCLFFLSLGHNWNLSEPRQYHCAKGTLGLGVSDVSGGWTEAFICFVPIDFYSLCCIFYFLVCCTDILISRSFPNKCTVFFNDPFLTK